jgi:hypothetical protein
MEKEATGRKKGKKERRRNDNLFMQSGAGFPARTLLMADL